MDGGGGVFDRAGGGREELKNAVEGRRNHEMTTAVPGTMMP